MVNPSGRDVYGASRLAKRIALSRAHTILVQNKFQQEQVLQAFPSKPIYFLRNPIKIPELESSNPRLGTGVLWVGKFHSNKNPIGLVRIAKLLPGISFTMICNAGQRDVEEEIKSSLPMNVKLIEFVPPNKMGEWYQNATLHVSTSFQEGFPNTFLEAASYELPTFSLHVDPDGLMKQGILGACFYGDEQALATAILELFNHPAKGKLQGEIARRYVLQHHAYPKIKEELRLTMNKIKVQLSKPKEKKIEG
jgi:glycosyltransferase involved in cell wall biosynthesis